MGNSVSMVYWNSQVQNSQPRELELLFSITGAKAATDVYKSPTLFGFDTTAFGVGTASSSAGATLTQAMIDAHLGSTNEFLLAAFDSTSMGADAIGGVIAMSGQVAELYSMEAELVDTGSNNIIVENDHYLVQDAASLTSSSLSTQCAKGASGNIGWRVVFDGTPDLDGLTSGIIRVKFRWRSK